jgi:hypothetical protein
MTAAQREMALGRVSQSCSIGGSPFDLPGLDLPERTQELGKRPAMAA